MAQEVLISGTSNRAKVRNPVGVWALSFITLGIYGWYWWYQLNRELKDLGRARSAEGLGEEPVLSMLAWGLGGFALYVPVVWTIVTTSQRIQRGQRLVDEPDVLNGWVAGLLWVFTLGIGGFIYTQHSANKIWRTQPAAYGVAPEQSDADLDRVKKLAELTESGAITEEEYEAEKARVLRSPPSNGNS